jgi:hypothetical protein
VIPKFARRRNKYGAKPTEVDGHKFPSRKEARRYGELRLLERAGEIQNLALQPRYPIIINGVPVRYPSGVALEYRGDFRYLDTRTNRVVVEDVKGVRKTPRPPGVKKPRHEGTDTDASRIKRALVAAIYGIEVRVV